MSFFSNFFKKKENDQPVTTVSFSEKVGSVFADPDIPTLQGDYAKVVFLWAHSKTSPIKDNDSYARYFLYECGIRNPSKYHRELIAEGYFVEASVEQMLSSLKISELKEILGALGQSTTGKKDALVWRVANNADEALIERYCPEKQYALSEKGNEFLRVHDDYVLVHKHKNWGVSWQEYDAHKISGRNYYDTMWAIFNEQLSKQPRDYGRSQYLFLYQLLSEEGKREHALQMLLRVLYIDLSGIEGMQWYDMYRQGIYKEKEIRELFNIVIMLAPGIIHPIKEFEDVYTDDIVEELYEQKLPVQVCEKKLFLSIIHSVLDGSYDEEAISKKLKRAYYKFLRENLFR